MRRYRESTALASRIGRIAIHKGVMPVHVSSAGSMCSSHRVQETGSLGLVSVSDIGEATLAKQVPRRSDRPGTG